MALVMTNPTILLDTLSLNIETDVMMQLHFGPSMQINKPYIVGAAGTGKTARMKKICKKNGWRLISYQASNLSLEKITGVLTSKIAPDGSAIFTRSEIVCANKNVIYQPENWKPEDGTVIVFDDFHTLNKNFQPYMFELLGANSINGEMIPENTAIVLMGNGLNHKACAVSMSVPVSTRINWYYIHTDAQEWLKYAIGNGENGKVVAFLKYRGDLLIDNECRENTAAPCYRTWTGVSQWLNFCEKKGIVFNFEQLQQGILGRVGITAGSEFLNFIQYFSEWDIEKDIRRKDFADTLSNRIDGNPMKAWSFSVALFNFLDKRLKEGTTEKELKVIYDALVVAFQMESNGFKMKPLVITGFNYISDYVKLLEGEAKTKYSKQLDEFMDNMQRKLPVDWALYGLITQFFEIQRDPGDDEEIKRAYDKMGITK